MFFLINDNLLKRSAMNKRASLKGIYVLVLQIDKGVCINIGALGEKSFQKGTYLYVGSAQNNLMQRVKRHLKKDKRKFWHIDYLLEDKAATVVKVFYKKADKTGECLIANQISKQGTLIYGFGCSDCDCKSHLFYIDEAEFLQDFMQPINIRSK